MATYPSVEESLARLHAAGWSIGEVRAGDTWTVSSVNGDVGQSYCLLQQGWLALLHRRLSLET
jgi:hypothetical protein